jgi:hypothetical protein
MHIRKRPSKCGHRFACSYGHVDHKRKLCTVWWCPECGALCVRHKHKPGRPSRKEYEWVPTGPWPLIPRGIKHDDTRSTPNQVS